MRLSKLLIIFSTIGLIMLVACSNDDAGSEAKQEEAMDNLTDSGMPIVNEPISLDFFAGQAAESNDDWNDVMLYNHYEEMTNIEINWEMVPNASLEEKRNLALGSGSLPDAFHTARIGVNDLMKYGEQGVFIPLNDLIEEHAPNFRKILDEYPDVEKALTMPDGNIYGLPQMAAPDFHSVRLGAKPFINEEWLDSLGLDMPETTEDFYEYLKAVKNEDPNGNGEADEIPFGGPGLGPLYDYLRGSFGVSNAGSNNGNIDLDPETDELRFFPITEEYRQLLEYMNKLYSEELIEQNIFSIDHQQYLANSSEGRYGSTVWYSPPLIMGEEIGEKYTGMPVLEGPEGHKLWTTYWEASFGKGAFVITNENEHPAATIRWADHFYGDEGMQLFFMGIEGETYELDENGEPVYMDHILNSEEGLSLEQEASKYLTFPGGAYPSMLTKEYFQGAESSEIELETTEKLMPDLVENPLSAFMHTNEENDKLQGFGADIDKYVIEMRDKFIAGEESLDGWNNYVETIKSMGLENYMEIKNDAYERYLSN